MPDEKDDELTELLGRMSLRDVAKALLQRNREHRDTIRALRRIVQDREDTITRVRAALRRKAV